METANKRDEEDEIIEDWSHLRNNILNDDEHHDKQTLSKFSRHTESVFPLSIPRDDDNDPPLQMTLRCVCELTPLDMLDLYHGRADATGNRIWMGALLFIEAFVRPIPGPVDKDHLYDGMCFRDNNHAQAKAFTLLRMEMFDGKRVLELGTGTGASGIAIALSGLAHETRDKKDACSVYAKPSAVTLTDSDPNVLLLCQQNCEINLEGRQNESLSCKYSVCELEWGSENINMKDSPEIHPYLAPGSQDTIIATDVIYDLSALQPLLETTQIMLKRGGYFILSHIPRASVNWIISDPISIGEVLEKHIVEVAKKYSLEPLIADETVKELTWCRDLMQGRKDYAIRPRDLARLWGEEQLMASTDFNYEEMDSVGGSIMIFVKMDGGGK